MRTVWSGAVGDSFVVRDVQEGMPELAYTTVMTTLSRLAQKGLLRTKAVPQKRAYEYAQALSPAEFVIRSSRQDVENIVRRYGDAALAAFAVRLDRLTEEQRVRLRGLEEE
jgi:predicted transcriptional regulator